VACQASQRGHAQPTALAPTEAESSATYNLALENGSLVVRGLSRVSERLLKSTETAAFAVLPTIGACDRQSRLRQYRPSFAQRKKKNDRLMAFEGSPLWGQIEKGQPAASVGPAMNIQRRECLLVNYTGTAEALRAVNRCEPAS
jgi:hypothetical protein